MLNLVARKAYIIRRYFLSADIGHSNTNLEKTEPVSDYQRHVDPRLQRKIDCLFAPLDRAGADATGQWKLPFCTLGVFKDREKINRKVLSRFAEVCDYQFSSLAANQEKITGYLQSQLDSAQLKPATHKRMRQN